MKTSDGSSRFSGSYIKDFILAAVTGKTIEFTSIMWSYTMAIRKLTRFSLFIPDFKVLNVHEQKALLLHNLDPMFNIKSGYFFHTNCTIGLAEQLERFNIFEYSTVSEFVQLFSI